jgi:hypothetical protein
MVRVVIVAVEVEVDDMVDDDIVLDPISSMICLSVEVDFELVAARVTVGIVSIKKTINLFGKFFFIIKFCDAII